MIVVSALVPPHRVVVPAERVETIGDEADAAGARATDLSTLLGIPTPSGVRRALLLRGEAKVRWIVVGERVVLRDVRRDAFGALPRWLAGVSARLPIGGLVAMDGAFALVLDVPRLVDPPVAEREAT